MKLDRNINPDGRGKYALIHLRELHELEYANIEVQKEGEHRPVNIPSKAIHIGNEGPGEQFFVIKYKDEFAAPALWAYSDAVKEKARILSYSDERKAKELYEFAEEIEAEARQAEHIADKKLPD